VISAERRQEVIQKFRTHEMDTGSPEVQVAIYRTDRPATEHFKTHEKDHHRVEAARW
jgi:small subunit ribosomal protein S15